MWKRKQRLRDVNGRPEEDRATDDLDGRPAKTARRVTLWQASSSLCLSQPDGKIVSTDPCRLDTRSSGPLPVGFEGLRVHSSVYVGISVAICGLFDLSERWAVGRPASRSRRRTPRRTADRDGDLRRDQLDNRRESPAASGRLEPGGGREWRVREDGNAPLRGWSGGERQGGEAQGRLTVRLAGGGYR